MIIRLSSWGRALVALGLAAGWAASAVAQDTTYVLVPSVPGQSQDPNHPNWIEAYGLSASSTNPGGAPDHETIHVLKGTDMSTPVLLQKLSANADLGLVEIHVCRNPPGGQECYYKLFLDQARIVELSLSGSSCIDPGTSCTPSQTESVAFSFTKITWNHVGFPGSGKSTCSCWDLQKGGSCGCTP